MTTLITYRGDVAGFATADRFYPAPHVAALPNGDPVKRVVAFMWLYDQELRAGRLPGEYSDEKAQLFARLALIDDDEFVDLDRPGTGDHQLAEHFSVPIEQIAAKRGDISRLAAKERR